MYNIILPIILYYKISYLKLEYFKFCLHLYIAFNM